jgi:hypothetical protein
MADFGPLGGVKVTGFISPTDTNDTYAVIDPWYGIDGLRNYSGGTSNLHTIPELRRRAGMIVGISGGTDYYKLNSSPWSYDMSDWTLLNFTGGGGSTTLSGLTDTTITTPQSGDTLTYINNTWVNLSTVNIYFVPSSDGQTYFTTQLPTQPSIPSLAECWINGQKQRYGVSYDFVLSGGTNQDFVWVSGNFGLNTTDEINLKYK